MYLLDTNILSELIRRIPNPLVAGRYSATPIEQRFTSSICIEEIRFGSKIGPPGNRLWERMEALVLPQVKVLGFDESLAMIAGDLRAAWKISGTPVGYPDGLIAATAKGHGLTLVTRNVKHFDHVTGLKVENWFEAKMSGQS